MAVKVTPGTRRRRRMGAMALAYSVVVIAALLLAAALATRHSLRWDLTESRRHSLSDKTLAILEAIPDDAPPIRLIAVTSVIAGGGDELEARKQLEPLLALLAHASPKLAPQIVLAESEPQVVEQLGIRRVPEIVLQWPGPAGTPEGTPAREQRTDNVTEEGVAQALESLLAGERRIAHVLAGHGELGLEDDGPQGLQALGQLLEDDNFELRPLVLSGSGGIPKGGELLLIAGPETDLLAEEIAALRAHVADGGRILLLLGPQRVPGTQPNLMAWLRDDWSILPADGVIADFDVPLGGNPVMLIVQAKEQFRHAIVTGFEKLVQLPVARPLRWSTTAPVGVALDTVLSSGPRSWLETDLVTSPPRFDEGPDLPGPYPVVVAATRQPDGQASASRMVVVGSRLLGASMFVHEVGNADLLRNCTDWLAGREADIARRSKAGRDGTVVVPHEQGLLIFGTAMAIPLIVALGGVIAWWRRRGL